MFFLICPVLHAKVVDPTAAASDVDGSLLVIVDDGGATVPAAAAAAAPLPPVLVDEANGHKDGGADQGGDHTPDGIGLEYKKRSGQ